MAHRVLILEDDESLRLVIAKALSRAGFEVRATASVDAALERLARREVDVLLADVLLGRESFLDRLNEVTRVRPDIPVIIMSAQTTARTAIEAGKAGVFEYLPKPFDLNEMVAVIKRSLEDVGPVIPVSSSQGFGGLVGRSPAMQEAFRALGRLARTSSPVLFTGPDGSGRAHSARVLVAESGVAGPVIEAGPARMRREGPALLEAAAGGALILRRAEHWDDETQDWVIEALETPRGDSPRILATGTPDIARHVRPALLSHLAIGRVQLPPLRDRGEDRALLFAHFLAEHASPREMHDQLRAFINTQVWPGEVLGLKRVALHLSMQGARGPLSIEEVEAAIHEFSSRDPGADLSEAAARFFGAALALGESGIGEKAQIAVDRGLFSAALESSNGVRQDAAKLLGLNRNTLTRRLSALNADSDET
ncbi:response regulator [Oceanicaulis sp.]|uniref:response regulator n=1 Tax=Oceanicaulis sp. TaxID=1924941 RepID=UPI003F7098C7